MVASTKYVHIKSTTVYAPRRIWDSLNPFLFLGGGGTLACGWGVGGSPNSDEGHTLWYSLYVRTLWLRGIVEKGANIYGSSGRYNKTFRIYLIIIVHLYIVNRTKAFFMNCAARNRNSKETKFFYCRWNGQYQRLLAGCLKVGYGHLETPG
jgi:hypothetical protein